MPRAAGVLLTAHGTVADLDELPRFLSRIRGGRPVPPALVQETRRRYELIGGSPLLAVTERQAALVAERLGVPVLVGMRLAEPSLEAALERAAAQGLEHLAVVPLAPFSVHVYGAAAEAARSRAIERGEGCPELHLARPWGENASLVEAHAAAIAPHLTADARLVLTAHSLPMVALRGGDPYEQQVRASAAAIGRELGRPFELAFQSQGADGGEWLGPTLKRSLEAAREAGARRVVVAPFGFLSEHVETLYDLDVEASGWAKALSLEFARVPALGTADGLIRALTEVASVALGGTP